MQPDIVVTGALGNVGAEVVNSLRAQGIAVTAADRSPDRIQDRFGTGVMPVAFDFERPETYAPAFQCQHRMFLMRPPQITDVQGTLLPAIDAAIVAGVQHIVFLSLIGIEQNKRVPHFTVEQHLKASGTGYTFLRASFFMQNLNTTHRAEIRDHDEIYVPVGTGRTSFIDARDIGAVAALALAQPGHENQAYDLTGPEALDYYQVAGIFSQVLGRTIRYRNPSSAAYLLRQLRQGSPLMFALVTTWLYNSTRNGMAEGVTGEVQRLLARPPIRLRQYVEDYRDCWRP